MVIDFCQAEKSGLTLSGSPKVSYNRWPRLRSSRLGERKAPIPNLPCTEDTSTPTRSQKSNALSTAVAEHALHNQVTEDLRILAWANVQSDVRLEV